MVEETVRNAEDGFESHTKLDADFCDVFDRACARVGIDAFRSEYEIVTPTIASVHFEK